MAFLYFITATDVISDLYWNSVVLAMKFNGSSLVDEKGHLASFSGVAALSTLVSKYDGSSLHINGGSVQVTASPNFLLPGQFTIEYWVYFDSFGGDITMFEIGGGNTTGIGRFSGNIRFIWNGGVVIATAWTPTINNWYHIAVSRDASNNIRLFMNGILIGSASNINGTMGSSSKPVIIGAWDTSNNGSFNGYMDDVRITNGVCRYTTNFTPPTSIVPQ